MLQIGLFQDDVKWTLLRRHKSDLLKMLKIRRFQYIINWTSSRQPKSNVFKTSKIRRLDNVLFGCNTFLRHPEDVLKTSMLAWYLFKVTKFSSNSGISIVDFEQ